MGSESKFIIELTGDDTKIRDMIDSLAKDSKIKLKQVGNETEKQTEASFGDVANQLKKLTVLGLGVGAVYQAMNLALDATHMAEDIRAVNKQFEILTSQAGIATDTLQAGLVSAAGGLVDTEDLLKAANKAIVTLGESASATPQLMEIARKSTAVFGGELLSNFESLNQAIANGQTKALKNLGIIIDSEKAYRDYAQSIGVSEKFLTQAGKQQAILNAVLEKGNTQLRDVDVNMRKNADNSARFKVALGELGDAAAIAFDKIFGRSVSNASSKLTGTIEYLTNLLKSKFGDGAEKSAAGVAVLRKEIEHVNREILAIKNSGGTLVDTGQEARLARLTSELKKYDEQNERSMMLEMKKQQAMGGGPKKSAVPDNVIDFEKVREARLAFNKELTQANEDSIMLKAQNAITQEQLEISINERKKLIEDQYQLELAEKKKLYLESGVANKAAFDNLEMALEEKKKQRLIQLEKEANANLLKMRQMAQSGILNGLVNAFSALGAALVRSENGFEAFGKAVLSSMGAIAIQMGALLVQIGLGFAALGPVMPVWGLSGAAAVAAGLGLIVLGGALQAAGGGGGSGGGGAGGGDAGAGASATSTNDLSGMTTDMEDLERTKPKTEVVVQVQGNVFNGREQAQIIAESLNDWFASNGGYLARTS